MYNMISLKVVDDLRQIEVEELVEVTRTTPFDFGLGPDSDLTNRWDTLASSPNHSTDRSEIFWRLMSPTLEWSRIEVS